MEKDDARVRLMLGYLCISSETGAGLVRHVEILDRFGLPDSEIAGICGCTTPSVAVARNKLKKRRDGTRAAKTKKR